MSYARTIVPVSVDGVQCQPHASEKQPRRDVEGAEEKDDAVPAGVDDGGEKVSDVAQSVKCGDI